MFSLVHRLRHPLELSSLVELGRRLSIYDQISKGGGVLGTFRQGSFGEVVVMRWSEKKDALAACLSVLSSHEPEVMLKDERQDRSRRAPAEGHFTRKC